MDARRVRCPRAVEEHQATLDVGAECHLTQHKTAMGTTVVEKEGRECRDTKMWNMY